MGARPNSRAEWQVHGYYPQEGCESSTEGLLLPRIESCAVLLKPGEPEWTTRSTSATRPASAAAPPMMEPLGPVTSLEQLMVEAVKVTELVELQPIMLSWVVVTQEVWL
ncbi:MAG TPA: hypothetical protein VN754_14420 [Candidatus Binataceae bacterium]|nr:hypothetical protein [Candidatus Binataceae bacterium]